MCIIYGMRNGWFCSLQYYVNLPFSSINMPYTNSENSLVDISYPMYFKYFI